MSITVRQNIDSQIRWFMNNGHTPNLIVLSQNAYDDLRHDMSWMVNGGALITKYEGIPVAIEISCIPVVVHAYGIVWATQDAQVIRLPLSKTEKEAYKVFGVYLKEQVDSLKQQIQDIS